MTREEVEKLICKWCGQRNATHELVIYHLNEEKSVVANGPKVNQMVRGSKYISVRLCKRCLPATTFEDLARELHEDSERRKKVERFL